MASYQAPIDPLEPRRLLSGAPAQLLAALPAVNADINVDLDETAIANGRLFFSGFRQGDIERLWTTDGAGGATLLYTSPASDHSISGMRAFKGKLYFFAEGQSGPGLYSSDGTPAGTQLVKAYALPSPLPARTFVLNDRLYFFWGHPEDPIELWSTDGTPDGAVHVWTAPEETRGIDTTTISPVINGQVFWGAESQLWRTDGTADGTVSTYGGFASGAYPGRFAAAGEKLFFTSVGFGTRRLYVANLDGTNVRNISIPSNPNFVAGVDGELTAVGQRMLFTSRTPDSSMDRLFATDGTDAGTVQLAGGVAFGQYFNHLSQAFALAPGSAVFSQGSMDSAQNGFFTTDGTIAGTHRILPTTSPLQFTALSKVFGFSPPSSVGIGAYESDGTSGGTRFIHYLGTGTPFSTSMRYLDTLDGRLVVSSTRNGIIEIWSLDPDVPTGSITGKSFTDLNRNGARDGFESHYGGTAYLDLDGDHALNYNADLASPSQDDKPYLFEGLTPGHYSVRFSPTLPMSTPASGAHEIDLQPGQNISASFGIINNSPTIWGSVFNDLNRNGVRDPDEGPASGQLMYADLNGNRFWDSGTEPASQSDAEGYYGFALASAGTYTIRRDITPGWTQTNPPGRAGISMTLAAGELQQAPAMGITQAVAGSIIGNVWYDWNRSATRDDGDSPAQGAEIYIDVNEDGKWNVQEPKTTASSSGTYSFSNLIPDVYTIRWIPGLGTNPQQTYPSPAGSGHVVTVPEAGSVTAPDFLIYTSPAGQIRGTVWNDRDGDGIFDADEDTLANRVVFIDANNNNVFDPNERAALTDFRGAYSITKVPAGTYNLRQQLPVSWLQSYPAAGPLVVTIADGQQLTGQNLGEINDSTPPTVQSAEYDYTINKLRIVFSEDVGTSVGTGDVSIKWRAAAGAFQLRRRHAYCPL